MQNQTNAELFTAALGIYNIDDGFLNHMRQTDENVPDDNYCSCFFGPVFRNQDGINFFAPVCRTPEMQGATVLERQANGIFGSLNLNRMIPCMDDFLIGILNPGEDFSEEFEFLKSSISIIESIAKSVYERQL